MRGYETYQYLLFERPEEGVLLVTMNRPEVGNANNPPMHREMGQVWIDVGRDPDTRAVVLTGAGDRFSMGGELPGAGGPQSSDDEERRDDVRSWHEVVAIVENMLNLDKPIVSAINGAALASGLAVALGADISIISETARVSDGHTRGGMVAGDHAALLWPLLTSMMKAKYYLLTAAPIDGREAERIGLVTFAVPAEEVLPRALEIAHALAIGPEQAIRWTKRTLNHWYRQATPVFELSAALEMLSRAVPGAAEAGTAMREAMSSHHGQKDVQRSEGGADPAYGASAT
jgi:enoyl-CoA hydratase